MAHHGMIGITINKYKESPEKKKHVGNYKYKESHEKKLCFQLGREHETPSRCDDNQSPTTLQRF